MKVIPVLLLLAAFPISQKDKDKPSISVKASPVVAFSPAHVVVTADIKGGANDYEEFYCPSVEWEWGDGTKSNVLPDCDPYVAGKSEIKRHFTADRVFDTAGDYRIEFRLKRKDKTVAVGSTMVKIRPGIRDMGDIR
jgi:hypothetical protein